MVSERGDKPIQPLLEVYLLGVLDYEDALRLQRRLVYEVSGAGGQLAALILCEHPAIISVGRSGSRSHIECDDEQLAARGLGIRWVSRGGGCMLHVPGQLAIYPIWPFQPSSARVRDYLSRLERCLLEVLEEFSVRAKPQADHTGLWTPAGQIAAVGISLSRWVSYHGVTLNVGGPTDRFRILHPERNGALRATTMEAERQRPAPMAKVRECLVRKFIETFELERSTFYSAHPMLKQRRSLHVYAASSR